MRLSVHLPVLEVPEDVDRMRLHPGQVRRHGVQFVLRVEPETSDILAEDLLDLDVGGFALLPIGRAQRLL